MKKILVLLLSFCLVPAVTFAEIINFNDIQENTAIYYNPNTEEWFDNCNDNKCIKFVKSYTTGENKYSEYIANGLNYDSNSTMEFLRNGELIAYNQNTLKFHRLYFEDGTFKPEKLNEEELSELFPECTIIRVSNFKDNEIKIKRPLFRDQKFLIMNDTNKIFYNYHFENLDNSNEIFNCIFTPKRARRYYFSPKDKSAFYGKYTIHIRYML